MSHYRLVCCLQCHKDSLRVLFLYLLCNVLDGNGFSFSIACQLSPSTPFFMNLNIYCGADKSLARPGRKHARKPVRYARVFNNTEPQDIKLFFPARQGAEGNSRHSDRNISLFPLLVRIRTYQQSCR